MKENLPVFSVIIPTYNRGKLLSRAIDSILNQTYSDFELIIVDDGSIDNTEELVKEYLHLDSRVNYIYKKNGGQNSALNVGLKHAKGQFISFCDSDDYWLCSKLEKVYEKFQSDLSIDVVYHSVAYNRSGEMEIINNDYLEGRVYKEILMQEFLCPPIALSAKKNCFEEVGGIDESFEMYQDDDICFTLAKKYKVGLVQEALSMMGDEADDRISENCNKSAKDYMKLIEKYKEDILEYCGAEKLSEMYYKATIKCSRAKRKDDAKSAWKSYRRCQKVGVVFFLFYYYFQVRMMLENGKKRIVDFLDYI